MSGLAGKIRGATESDEFDLAGYTKDRCEELVPAAFGEPFTLSSMVRLSFVVGGGKLCRQKYSDDLPKDLCAALAKLGFSEDNAAACELSSGGSYKFQHDTSKNLKFVHVFPRVEAPAAEDGNEDGEGAEGDAVAQNPADILATCEADDFKRIIVEHVCGYAQKKRLLEILKERLAKLEAAEQKLIARETLEADEQQLYDTHSQEELKAKLQVSKQLLQAAVDEGKLNPAERSAVLEDLGSKLSALEAELKKAETDGKAKVVQKLEEQREKMKKMRVAVSDAPAFDVPVRHGAEICKLRVKLNALVKLEKEKAGKSYTMDELKRLGEKGELEEAIQILEDRSRMWFETQEEFKERLQKCLREGLDAAKKAASRPSASAWGSSSSNGYPASSGWTSVGKAKGKARR